MIDGKKVLGVIPARGGSKGLRGKNIRLVAGKPLIAWTIEAARASKYLDRVILSSDDDAIISVALAHGCEVPFKRRSDLAADDTPSIDVVIDALGKCPGYDWVVLLQPTSPLRTAHDIDATIDRCVVLGAPAGVTVCQVQENPYWMITLTAGDRLRPLLTTGEAIVRRQDLPPVYSLNGAVYVAAAVWLSKTGTFVTDETVAYEMPAERSVDIDTEADLAKLRLQLELSGNATLSPSA